MASFEYGIESCFVKESLYMIELLAYITTNVTMEAKNSIYDFKFVNMLILFVLLSTIHA